MGDPQPTEQQVDTARARAERDSKDTAHVRIMLGDAARGAYELSPAGIAIGRDEGDVILDDGLISRRHVEIDRGPAGWRLTDLGSKNGGYVDGRRFQPKESVLLADGAVIRLGGSLLVFRASPAVKDARSDAQPFPGVSPVAAEVRRRIDVLTMASGHALILGETGTGKERVAHELAAPRKGLPFVAQNCGELDRSLARAELFGYVAGAFTGATQSKPGLIDAAGNGALFLDEIGELSLDVQVDLLRFLEDGTYRPVAAPKTSCSTARVIAATNVDLERAVAQGKFRRDLEARLRASNEPLVLPPLRDRREDIPQWTRRFASEVDPSLTGELWTVGALECLLLYPWLGNLRELRGVVRALIADRVALPCATERLPQRIQAHRDSLRGPRDEPVAPSREITQAEIEEALRQTRGNVLGTARLLDVERTKLYRLFKDLGISPRRYRGPNDPGDDDEEG
ncbi:MAG TPA: sigma 54-interacting transcriptional regulator [Kofleriaceae bacterium]|nr:sigma 54-interacting transcriptional regulator [Kofleriaceae bacterium]